jgi:hypothetical protein
MFNSEQIQLLKTTKEKELTILNEERLNYYGILSEYQLHPQNLVQNLSYRKLNPYQHFLFKRVLHGLNMYDTQEKAKLHWDKKRRITRVWKRAQEELNTWKQIICNKKVNAYFRDNFTGSTAEYIMSIPPEETLRDYKNTMTLKDLGITYEDVILRFMQKGLLPRTFLTLKAA